MFADQSVSDIERIARSGKLQLGRGLRVRYYEVAQRFAIRSSDADSGNRHVTGATHKLDFGRADVVEDNRKGRSRSCRPHDFVREKADASLYQGPFAAQILGQIAVGLANIDEWQYHRIIRMNSSRWKRADGGQGSADTRTSRNDAKCVIGNGLGEVAHDCYLFDGGTIGPALRQVDGKSGVGNAKPHVMTEPEASSVTAHICIGKIVVPSGMRENLLDIAIAEVCIGA